jgi:hypothetical protein
MNAFVVVPCPKCQNQVYVSPAAGMGYCAKCMSQVPIPPGGAPPANFGAPGMGGAAGAPPAGAPGMGGYGPPAGAPGMGAPPGGAPGMGGYGPPAGGAPGMGAYGPPPGGAPGMGGPPPGGAPGMGAYGAPPGGAPGMGGAPPAGAPGMGAPPPGGVAVGAYGMPGGFPMTGAKRPPMAAIFGSVALTIVASVGYGIFRAFVGGSSRGPGKTSPSSLGIDEKAADPDKMIAACRALAKKWQPDAEFYSINVLGLGPSGTVDLTAGGSVVTVEFFSPSRVTSPSQSVRSDSIKKFTFNSVGLDYSDIWGVKEKQDHVGATPTPTCTAKQVAAALASKGLKAGKTVQLSLDPTFSFATKEPSWHALSSDPKIDAWLSVATCAPTK